MLLNILYTPSGDRKTWYQNFIRQFEKLYFWPHYKPYQAFRNITSPHRTLPNQYILIYNIVSDIYSDISWIILIYFDTYWYILIHSELYKTFLCILTFFGYLFIYTDVFWYILKVLWHILIQYFDPLFKYNLIIFEMLYYIHIYYEIN